MLSVSPSTARLYRTGCTTTSLHPGSRPTLHVGGTVWDTKASVKIEAPKVERSRRTIRVDALRIQELRQYKAQQAATGLRLGIAQNNDWFIFPVAPDRPKAFAKRFVALLESTRFVEARPHDLRHAHGSILLSKMRAPARGSRAARPQSDDVCEGLRA